VRQSSADRWPDLNRRFHDILTWSFAFILCIVPLTISVRGVTGAGLIKTVVAQSLILIVLAAWLIKIGVLNTRPRTLPGLHVPIAIFICLNALSLLRTSDLGSGLLKFSQLLLFASVTIVCTDIFGRREDVLKVFGTTVFAGFLVSAYGIAQHYGMDFIHWEMMRLDIRKAPATFGNPNFAAEFLVAALPLSAALFLVLPGFWRRAAIAVCTCMMLLHLSFTHARAGVVGLAAAAVVMVLLLVPNKVSQRKARKTARIRWLIAIVVVAALLLGCIALATSRYPHEMLRVLDENTVARLLTWRSTLAMIRHNPAGGVGLGDFYATMPQYWSPSDQRAFVEENTVTRSAHNDYLEIGAETGIPGLAVFLLILIATGVLIGQRVTRERSFRSKAVLAAIGAGLAGISVQAAFTFSLQNASSALLFWTLLGLAGGMIRSGTQGSAEPVTVPQTGLHRPTRTLLYVFAVALVSCVPARFRAIGADYRLRAAETLLEEEKFDEAVAELDRAFMLDPFNFETLFKKGGAMTTLGENRQAELAYRRCLEFRPHDVLTLTNLGLLLLNETRVEKALPLFKRACAIAPNDPVARRGLASCYAALGNQALATSELRTAMHYHPEDAQIVLELARCYRRAGRVEDAIVRYERALSLGTDSVAALIELGTLYLASGNHAAATKLLERALLVNPAATEGRVALAQAYLQGGRLLESALECGNYIVRGGADSERARSLALQIGAQLSTARWRDEQARAELVRFVLARIFLAFGEPERARQQLMQIADHNESLLFQQRVIQTLAQFEEHAVETRSGQSDDT